MGVCSEIIVVSAHVAVKDKKLSQTQKIYEKIEGKLRQKHGVSHATLQFETADYACKKFGVCNVCH